MAVELNAEPGCASIDYGRLVWRRAMFREAGGQLEAAVELQITTIGDAGPGLATLITRVWLAEFAGSGRALSGRTADYGTRSVARLGSVRREPVASVPADVADQPYPGFTISSRTTVGAGWTSVASSPLAADSGLSQSCFLQPWRPRTRLSRMVFHDNAQGLVMLSLQGFAPRLLLATAVAISAVACDQPPPEAEAARVTVWDSAGVEIVENHAPESGDSAFWSVDPEPALVIGGSTVVDSPDDPSQLVWEVQGLARLSDGRVLVHSGGEEAVFLFEPTGELVTRIGRKGPGSRRVCPTPSTFRCCRATPLSSGTMASPGSTTSTQWGLSSARGNLTSRPCSPTHGRPPNTPRRTSGFPFRDGSFIVQRGLNDQAPPAPRRNYSGGPVEYLRIDTDYSVHSFGWWRWREGLGTTTMLSYPWPPFPVYPRVAAGGDPLSVHVADGGWYGIHQFVPDGTLRRIIRRETVPVPITPEELSEWKRSARDRYPGFGWPESDFGWPEWERALAAAPPREFHPAIRWLVVDTEGFLWVWGPGDSGADVFDHGRTVVGKRGGRARRCAVDRRGIDPRGPRRSGYRCPEDRGVSAEA